MSTMAPASLLPEAADMYSERMSFAVDKLSSRELMLGLVALSTSVCIARTFGAGMPTMAGILVSGSIPGFMPGVGIPGARRFSGASGLGVGEDRGGASTADGGILILTTRVRRSGLPII